MTHASAVDFCNNLGASIATPDDPQQNTYMAAQFPNQKIWFGHKCTGDCADPGAWPGYGNNGWTGNWADGQPNCGDGGCNVCARTDNSNNEWNDGNCYEEWRFLCRRNTWSSAFGHKWLAVDAPMTHASAVDFCNNLGA